MSAGPCTGKLVLREFARPADATAALICLETPLFGSSPNARFRPGRPWSEIASNWARCQKSALCSASIGPCEPFNDDCGFEPSPHGVGTPIDFSRACARRARTFIPSRYVLTSFPGRFSTLHPSCQYSSICASVSADPRASLPCIACRRNPPHRRLESRVLEVEVNPKLRAQVGMPITRSCWCARGAAPQLVG